MYILYNYIYIIMYIYIYNTWYRHLRKVKLGAQQRHYLHALNTSHTPLSYNGELNICMYIIYTYVLCMSIHTHTHTHTHTRTYININIYIYIYIYIYMYRGVVLK